MCLVTDCDGLILSLKLCCAIWFMVDVVVRFDGVS
jgi:hypothetical protein